MTQTIRLEADGLRLELLTSGASVRRLVLGEDEVDVALGHADPATYVGGGGYLGATGGRAPTRLDSGRLELDGRVYELSTNQFGNTLHGGVRGFDAHEWELVETDDRRARFTLTSPDGDQGFPGRLDVDVTYEVAPGEVRIRYRAVTDAPTVVNLTNHTYLNLDGEGSGTVDDHLLEVPAGSYLPVREDLVPTGEVAPVAGTPFDLRSPTRVGDALGHDDEQLRRAGGLDHCFVLGGSGLRPAARLEGRSGRVLEVLTDQPGVQVYTGAHFDGTLRGVGGQPYGPRAGIALETQGLPDAPHQPGFPSAVLRPGEEYATTTVWRFTS
jgi:aldose 1-epimerase